MTYQDEGFANDSAQSGGAGGSAGAYQLHLMMRGRYFIAIALAVVLAACGGLIGFKSGKKLYQSTALVRVVPTLPRVLYENEERTINRFEQFVDTQIALISTRKVVESAMREQVWTKTGAVGTDEAILKFMDSLSVIRRNELLQINFVSDDPEVAVAGAQSVLNAYQKVASEEDAISGQRRIEVLQTLQSSLNAEVLAKRQRIQALAGEVGATEIARLYDVKLSEVQRLESLVRELQAVVATTRPTDGPLTPFTPEEWASRDPAMATLITDQMIKRRTLESLRVKYLESSSILQAAERDYAVATQAVEQRAQMLESKRANPGQLSSADDEVKAAKLVQAKAALDQSKDEFHRLGRLNSQIQDAKAEMEETRQNLEDTRKRIEQLRVEAFAGGRISVPGPADRPLQAWKDTRVRYGGAGALGGCMLGFGVVLVFGLFDDRVRHSMQAVKGTEMPPVIGLLPDVTSTSDAPDQSAEVARALHLIRASLQLSGTRGKAQVLAVTGPLPGSGKTSLTLGLGTSFGRSGSRTLLVDFDPIGRGLSHTISTRVTRRLGTLLLERGAVTAEQLGQGLAHAEKTSRKIGEALVDLGFVTRAVVDEELGRQAQSSAGVVDALGGESIDACVVKTPYNNVWLMPAGDFTPGSAGTVSPTQMQQLVQRMSGQFDTILFDTGPLPGCVESALAAAVSDQTVVVVSRGDSRRSLLRTVSSIRQVNARCAGLVYNRAEMGDYFESSSSVSRQMSRPGAKLHTTLLAEPVG